MIRYRTYKLPNGDGYYVVFEDNKAYHFPEQVPFKEAAKACLLVLADDTANSWKGFIIDFNTFGTKGFGLYGACSVEV